MAGNPFTQLVFDLFIISAILITAYTCNFYYLVLLANKRNKSTKTVDLGTPSVTIQLPIYNEKYVCLLYTSPSPRDGLLSRMPSSA